MSTAIEWLKTNYPKSCDVTFEAVENGVFACKLRVGSVIVGSVATTRAEAAILAAEKAANALGWEPALGPN